MKNKIFDLGVVAVLGFIFLSVFIFSNGMNSLMVQLKTVNLNWILLGVLCIFLFWFFETLILYIITKSLYSSKFLFLKSIKFAMTGQFFSAITPFQSGGQPSQLYIMTENDIPVGISGSVLMVKFIIHQSTLTIYSVIVILAKYKYFNSKIPYFIYFCIIGFVFNTALIILALIFSINEKMTMTISSWILNVVKKIKKIKNLEAKCNTIEDEIKSFHKNSAIMAKNIKMCFVASIYTFIQWTLFYSIPFCIYKSFGLSSTNLWTMICAQVFLTMFMSFIPLPGAAGGAEGGFYLIFGIFFKGNTIVPAIFMWRMMTYYICIAMGGISTVILPNISSKNQKHT